MYDRCKNKYLTGKQHNVLSRFQKPYCPQTAPFVRIFREGVSKFSSSFQWNNFRFCNTLAHAMEPIFMCY